jgi:hypothetical protein
MNIQPTTILRGALTLVPGIERFAPRIGIGTGGTNSAAYCYGVWMKHLGMLHRNGLRAVPATLAELGPGDSLGIGLAAMLSGVDHYYALDVVDHVASGANLAIFDELVELYRRRASCPRKGFVEYSEGTGDHAFPSDILDEATLARTLAPERIAAIRRLLAGDREPSSGLGIHFMVPWHDASVMRPGSVDLLLSHSVLEHVVDLEATYAAMRRWLRPGGWMSHQIDFKSHGLAREWNGYRGYPEPLWKLVLGSRPFLLNRQPWSTHARLLEENGFELVCVMRQHIRDRGLRRDQLASRWRGISEDDLTCAGAFVQARRAVLDAPGADETLAATATAAAV